MEMGTNTSGSCKNNNAIIRSTKRNCKKPWEPSKEQQKQARKLMLDQAVQMYMDAMLDNDGINVPPCTFSKILEAFGNPSWMSRHTIFYHFRKKKLSSTDEVVNTNNNLPKCTQVAVERPNELNDVMTTTLTSPHVVAPRNKGGRPSSMVNNTTDEWHAKIEKARVLASQEYQNVKNSKTKLPNGSLEKMIINSLLQVGLSEENSIYINKKTITSRVARNNIKGMSGSFSQTSPMASIEPLLAEVCRHLNSMGQPINQVEFLELANDIIEGSPTAELLKTYQHKICGVESKEGKKLGRKYFYNFMRRHKNVIYATKGHTHYVNDEELWKNMSESERIKAQKLLHKVREQASLSTATSTVSIPPPESAAI